LDSPAGAVGKGSSLMRTEVASKDDEDAPRTPRASSHFPAETSARDASSHLKMRVDPVIATFVLPEAPAMARVDPFKLETLPSTRIDEFLPEPPGPLSRGRCCEAQPAQAMTIAKAVPAARNANR
jgi:hypothetical protein